MKKITFLFSILFFSLLASQAQVTVGSGIEPNTGAALDIKQFTTTDSRSDGKSTSQKGFNFPRVALQAADKLEPCATTNVTNNESHTGLVVYNTASDVMNEGLYYWNGGSWRRLIDEVPPIPTNTINMYYQTLRVMGGTAEGNDQSNMVSLQFSPTGTTHNPVIIRLPEKGSYAFNIKLYTALCDNVTQANKTPANAGIAIVYVGIWVNDVLQDVSEIFFYIGPRANGTIANTGQNVSNVILGCTGNAGDVIDIRLGYHQNSLSSNEAVYSQGAISPNPYSARTSMIYWKL